MYSQEPMVHHVVGMDGGGGGGGGGCGGHNYRFKGLFYVSNAHNTLGCRNFALKLQLRYPAGRLYA